MLQLEIKGNFEEILGVLSDELLEDIPLHVWEDAMLHLMNFMKEKVRLIQRKRVKKKTFQWRKWAHDHGRTVETFEGTFSNVLRGAKAGMRTGTLLGDLEFSQEPTVIKEIFRTREGSSLVYALDADIYAKSYPRIFSEWIEKVKGIESGLGVPEEEALIALEKLGETVLQVMSERWSR